MALPTNWENGAGQQVDAPFLNELCEAVNTNTDAIEAVPVLDSATAYVATAETTSSGTYAKLTTITDKVTVDIGSSKCALVFISGYISGATVNGTTIFTSFSCSGANTLAASDSRALAIPNTSPGTALYKDWFMLTPEQLTATGSTQFDLKYRCTGGAMGMQKRTLTVIALP